MRLIRPVGSRQTDDKRGRLKSLAKRGFPEGQNRSLLSNLRQSRYLHGRRIIGKELRLIPSINPFIAVTSYIQTFFSLKSLPTRSIISPSCKFWGPYLCLIRSAHSGKPIHYLNQGLHAATETGRLFVFNEQ